MNIIKFEDLNFTKYEKLMLWLFPRQQRENILDEIRKKLNQLESEG